ncbi:MAG TPA: hypothetical protein VGR10_04915, partial [Thermoleophilaceae bacterium]|nr:hypothetical protein [Thermoleophilaceae bacterium]
MHLMTKRLTRRLTIAALGALVAVIAATPAQAAERKQSIRLDGKRCDLIGVPAAAPVGVGRCRGVRPGAVVETPVGFCTLNFLFRDGDGDRYIGTAGHCILGDGRYRKVREREWGGRGPVARDAGGKAIGRFRYAVLRG